MPDSSIFEPRYPRVPLRFSFQFDVCHLPVTSCPLSQDQVGPLYGCSNKVVPGGLDCKTVRIFAYSSTHEQSNKRCGTRLKTESESGERRYGRVRLARFARIRLLRHALPISSLILREKTDCFAVYGRVALWNKRFPCSSCTFV